MSRLTSAVAALLLPPGSSRERLGRRLRRPWWLATVRRTTPLSPWWGVDRGTPIDRYYIEEFLSKHRGDIRGAVLEVKDSGYTDRFGTGVSRRDVLDIDVRNPMATVVADLAEADHVPTDTYDCAIVTQTLTYIYDVASAVRHTHRILRPGGVALVTVPSITRLCPPFLDYWRFTPLGCERLFGLHFGADAASVRARGNVGAAAAFLMGVACEELPRRVLEHDDDQFPVLVTIRAVKR
jgi:SAM-dependent methyltransferase